MSDYIKREDAIVELVEYYNSLVDFRGYDTIKKNTIGECIERIKSLPTADVVERKVGRWVEDYHLINDTYIYHCSVCGYECGQTREYMSSVHYCENCGAKMEDET